MLMTRQVSTMTSNCIQALQPPVHRRNQGVGVGVELGHGHMSVTWARALGGVNFASVNGGGVTADEIATVKRSVAAQSKRDMKVCYYYSPGRGN